MKPYWKPLLFVVALLTLFVAAQLSSPKPIDWTPTFDGMDKNPYGAFVLLSRLPDLFPDQNITPIQKSLYEFFTQSPRDAEFQPALYLYPASGQRANLIMFSRYFDLDSLDAQTLLRFVAAGNSAFLAASQFGDALSDTLRLKTQNSVWSAFFDIAPDSLNRKDTLRVNFSFAAHRRASPYQFSRLYEACVFSSFDTARATVLGIDEKGRANFIRAQFGEGAFYLCSNSYLFTNYYLLSQDGAEYVAKVLSFLPVQETLWDEYYKPFSSARRSSSPLRFILENDALRRAYYLALLGVALFFFVEGKRRQRAIPVVTPPQNSALEFVETVGRLYLQHGDHKDLAEKKIEHFFDFIRTHFYLNAISFSPEFYATLSEKSGATLQDIERLFALIASAKRSSALTEEDLLRLMQEIECFKNAITSRANAGYALSKSG